MSEDSLLTVDEVAKRLRAHPVTIRRMLREGRLQGSRPGGTKLGWRIASSEVDRLLTGSTPQGDAHNGRGQNHE